MTGKSSEQKQVINIIYCVTLF